VANKKTFLLLTAINLAKGNMLAGMRHWMERKRFDPNEKIKAITAVFDELNIREITTNKITSFCEDAYRSFMEVRCDSSRKQPLIHFVRSMLNREK